MSTNTKSPPLRPQKHPNNPSAQHSESNEISSPSRLASCLDLARAGELRMLASGRFPTRENLEFCIDRTNWVSLSFKHPTSWQVGIVMFAIWVGFSMWLCLFVCLSYSDYVVYVLCFDLPSVCFLSYGCLLWWFVSIYGALFYYWYIFLAAFPRDFSWFWISPQKLPKKCKKKNISKSLPKKKLTSRKKKKRKIHFFPLSVIFLVCQIAWFVSHPQLLPETWGGLLPRLAKSAKQASASSKCLKAMLRMGYGISMDWCSVFLCDVFFLLVYIKEKWNNTLEIIGVCYTSYSAW